MKGKKRVLIITTKRRDIPTCQPKAVTLEITYDESGKPILYEWGISEKHEERLRKNKSDMFDFKEK